MNERGWFADIDPAADPKWQWQPNLQLEGWYPSIDAWFATEAECIEFIRDEILDQGMLDEPKKLDGGKP